MAPSLLVGPFLPCALTRAAEAKRFIKGKHGAADYEALKVRFVRGKAPTLILYNEEDKEVERHLLSKLTAAEMHALVQSKGLQRRDGSEELEQEEWRREDEARADKEKQRQARRLEKEKEAQRNAKASEGREATGEAALKTHQEAAAVGDDSANTEL